MGRAGLGAACVAAIGWAFAACSSASVRPGVDTSSTLPPGHDAGGSSGGADDAGALDGASSSGGGAEVIVVPCNVNNPPGVVSATSYSPQHSYRVLVSGTCSLNPSSAWDAGDCRAEPRPMFPTTNDDGPVGTDAFFEFAEPGPCVGDASTPAPVPWSVSLLGLDSQEPGNFTQGNLTPYNVQHTYEMVWAPGNVGPVKFWVNDPNQPDSTPFYGALHVTLQPL